MYRTDLYVNFVLFQRENHIYNMSSPKLFIVGIVLALAVQNQGLSIPKIEILVGRPPVMDKRTNDKIFVGRPLVMDKQMEDVNERPLSVYQKPLVIDQEKPSADYQTPLVQAAEKRK